MRNRTRALAGVCGVWLVLGGASGALAGPPEDAEAPASEAPASEAGDAGDDAALAGGSSETDEAKPAAPPATASISVPSVRREMENDMAALGELAADARRDSDLVRAACVLDKQERAQGVMELATGEMLIIRDEGASTDARSFAVEKLQAASERLGGLVDQAKECIGDKTPEVSDDVTNNDVDEEPTIPVADPTIGGTPDGGKPGRVPPPVDDGAPPTVGSPSM